MIYRFIGPQFRQMVSKIIQDLEISSCNRFCHLYKSLPFTEKRPWSWYQGWLLRNGTRISVWNIPPGKTGLPFQMFRCSWKSSAGTTQNVLFHLLYPTGFSRNFLKIYSCKTFGSEKIFRSYFRLFMLPDVKCLTCSHPCYDLLTAVTIGYLLTSVTWLYPRLRWKIH